MIGVDVELGALSTTAPEARTQFAGDQMTSYQSV
jgi:hypothetical protein